MKVAYLLAFLLLFSSFLYSQHPARPDTIVQGKSKIDKQPKRVKEKKIKLHSDSTCKEIVKSAFSDVKKNKSGDLIDDDIMFNKRYHLWIPAVDVLGAIVFTMSWDKYVLNADYAHTGITTWKYNLKNGWEWDKDRFGMNFIAHPYSGTLSYNAGRSNGYNYFQSATFAIAGSVIWEYFGENTRPSYNDIINTPVNGAFLGEILYRISSNILDDRTRGKERIFREIAAGLINPIRGVNRMIQGKTFRKTSKEVYQKEPLNISLYAGLHLINEGSEALIEKGTTSQMMNIQLDYGNPFEERPRKAFDFFKLRTEFDFGVGRKILSNVTGYGLLFGANANYRKHSLLFGVFQYSDYWDNKTFELGAIGFGGGVFSILPLSKKTNVFTNVHLAFIPFAGNSTHIGPDTSQVRDYNFGNGLEGKFESTLILGKYATVSMIFYYYMIRTYVGASGNNFIGILKPRITIRIYKNISLGFENYIYYNDRYLRNHSEIHSVRTEQKIFLLLFLEDYHRRGHYN